jgi:hypothetical protein
MPDPKPFNFKRLGKNKPSHIPSAEQSIADQQAEILSAIGADNTNEQAQSNKKERELQAEVAQPIGPVETALRELETIRTSVVEYYGGKPGYNPYIWADRVLTPLKQRIKAGDSEAIKELMEMDATTVDCSVVGLGLPYGEDKGVFANNPRALQG